MMSKEEFRKVEALKLIKKYDLVESTKWGGRYTFKGICEKVFGYPLGLDVMGTVCFASRCILDRYNTINFEFWDSCVRIENFEKRILQLKKEYEKCKLRQKENNIRKKLKEIQEDFV